MNFWRKATPDHVQETPIFPAVRVGNNRFYCLYHCPWISLLELWPWLNFTFTSFIQNRSLLMTAVTLSLTPQQNVAAVFLCVNFFYYKSYILQLKHDDRLYLLVKYWLNLENFGSSPTFVLTCNSLKVSFPDLGYWTNISSHEGLPELLS